MRKESELKPRDGHTLRVIDVCRISGGQRQQEQSLSDQEDHAKVVITEMYDGPTEYTSISTKGKGENLERPELKQLEELIRTRRYDVLIAEDLGRIVRGIEAVKLCGIAVDHGMRVFIPNDDIDSINSNWEQDAMEACKEHTGHNTHTSKRLKNKLMNRFLRFGGAPAREISGYIVGDDAKTYSDWSKDEKATPIFKEWFDRLKNGQSFSAVADWLNAIGFPRGPYARTSKWIVSAVRNATQNSLLKGMPARGAPL